MCLALQAHLSILLVVSLCTSSSIQFAMESAQRAIFRRLFFLGFSVFHLLELVCAKLMIGKPVHREKCKQIVGTRDVDQPNVKHTTRVNQ